MDINYLAACPPNEPWCLPPKGLSVPVQCSLGQAPQQLQDQGRCHSTEAKLRTWPLPEPCWVAMLFISLWKTGAAASYLPPPPRSYWLWWGAKLPSRRGGTWMSRFLTVGFTLTGGAVRSGGLQLPSLSSTKLRSSFLHLEPTFHLLAFSLLWFILGLSWERCRDGNILSRRRGGIGDGGDTDSRVGRPCCIHLELSSSFSLPFVSLFSFFLPPCFPKPCSTNGNLAQY